MVVPIVIRRVTSRGTVFSVLGIVKGLVADRICKGVARAWGIAQEKGHLINVIKVNTAVKGRPRGNSSTRHDPGGWEYSKRGRGRSWSSSGRGRSSSASVHNASSSDAHRRVEIGNYHHIDKIPGIILPFVESYHDLLGDGNFRFRVVADYIFGDQDKWRLVRVCITNEIMANCTLYRSIYYDGIEPEVRRITWDGGPCGSDHWMAVAEDLFPIATIFNATIILFKFENRDLYFHVSLCCLLKNPQRQHGLAKTL
ncbi:hypothetical protein OROHE_007309 [Orobanche hederae]